MESNWKDIEIELEAGKDLALYHLPGSREIFQLMGRHCHPLHSIQELEGRKGFVAAPFACDKDDPILLIEGEVHSFPFIPSEDFELETKIHHSPIAEKEAYQKHFLLFKEAIDSGRFLKLVLSRRSRLENAEKFSPVETFLNACKAYPDSFVYLFSTEESGIWLGSTPEILLSGKGGKWKTVALAGTQACQEAGTSPVWDQKNKKEQAHVARYIREILTLRASGIEENGPYTTRAGKLFHLKTDFKFRLESSNEALSLLEDLHPTPAVCGLPKKEAFEFICRNEQDARRWYSGFTGILDLEKGTDLYVNLRCMEIQKKNTYLYAGGGLVPESQLEKEWMETENKMGTMGSLLP